MIRYTALGLLLAGFLSGSSAIAEPASENPAPLVLTQEVPDSDIPAHLMFVETWDGLYAPIALRKPEGEGPFPIVLLASGNGGEGVSWLRDAVANRGYIMERFLDAGYAVAWLRYRAEVDLGYNTGGPYREDVRQGRQLLSRSPLEYEDTIAIAEFVKSLPYIDADRVGYLGLSHGGEMALKMTSEYHGFAAAVASEPASHEFLSLSPDESASVNEATGLRNLEGLKMDAVDKVRARVDMDIAMERIVTIDTPFLVMGRDEDHLQGIFRVTHDLLEEAGKETAWVSYDHHDHGYVYPYRGEDGDYIVNEVQDKAISRVIEFFDTQME